MYVYRLLLKHGMDRARTSKSFMDLIYLKSIGEKEVFEDLTKYRPVWSEAYSTSPCRIDLILLPRRQLNETPVLLRNAYCDT